MISETAASLSLTVYQLLDAAQLHALEVQMQNKIGD